MSIYSALPETDATGIFIRILELLPSLNQDAEVKCKLHVVNLAILANLRFEAVSYTWAGQPIQPIQINDSPKLITENLLSFLRHRREQHESVKLWVDAVCINQDDVLEKNIQVGLMNVIYMGAAQTTIWLGPESQDSNLAIDTISDLGTTTAYEKMPTLSSEVYKAIQNLLNRPWWSRAWIVQEVILGGLGTKLSQLRLMCGSRELLWTTLVIAAVRMKAHQEDLRQHFPNVVRILELDKVRDNSHSYITGGTTPAMVLSLLTRYRDCQATDARDKVFAFARLFRAHPNTPTRSLRPDYAVSVEQTYINLALFMFAFGQGLELLRHCGRRCVDIPSWAPDWSTHFDHTPLPSNSGNWYTDVPWWAEPGEKVVDGKTFIFYQHQGYPTDPSLAQDQRHARIKRLQMDVDGSGMVNNIDEVPLAFAMNQASDKIKAQFQSLFETKQFVMYVADEPETENPAPQPAQILKRRNRTTERSMKRKILKELEISHVSYRAAGTTEPMVEATDDLKGLVTKGALWDRVKTVHEGFPTDVEANWHDATKFMVAVGQCKAIAMQATTTPSSSPYQDESCRLKAFWLTLFAGQIAEPNQFSHPDPSTSCMDYSSWLPSLPESWNPSIAPLTTLTTGHLKLAEMTQRFKFVAEEASSTTSDPDGTTTRYEVHSAIEFANLHDATWSSEQIKTYHAQFQDLASAWQTQPYDLYHRPFSLLNVVPDPYWETRKLKDERALAMTKEHLLKQTMFGSGEDSDDTVKPQDRTHLSSSSADEVSSWRHKLLSSFSSSTSEPSMIPQSTLSQGIEKYALGRRFFVTEKGYFGLGPRETSEGDFVAVVCGSSVPFLLRTFQADEFTVKYEGQNVAEWEVVGECYVHGIMEGEVVEEWRRQNWLWHDIMLR